MRNAHDAPHPGSALFVDRYEVAMAQAYAAEGMRGRAVFELAFRSLPRRRNYVVAAGLGALLDDLERFRFTDDDLRYLADAAIASPDFVEELRAFRFAGDVDAMPEGTVVFAGEPLVRVTAPLVQAQLVETLVINRLHLGSVLASKAARVVAAADGRPVVDFGARRAHGAEAARAAARALWLVGGAGTSNLVAGRLDGIPTFGTMAHSYVQTHRSEAEAFRRFLRIHPDATLLVDTYDTAGGIEAVIAVAADMGDHFEAGGVRLDSGDLAALAAMARARLDAAGLGRLRIVASGGLDEDAIAGLLAKGAPIDAFGVGTRLAVSADAPTLDIAYKLVEYDGRSTAKRSPGKATLPAVKQVLRTTRSGRFAGDVIAHADEDLPGARLLAPMMRAGVRTDQGRADLTHGRTLARQQIDSLPPALRALEDADPPYPVSVDDRLRASADRPPDRRP